MFLVAENIFIPDKKIGTILQDPKKSAAAVHLQYISDTQPGIRRVKKGGKFTYFDEKKKVKDKNTLRRIKGLAIPPAWENVWICKSESGHLQATGTDLKKRKQYKYHPLWNSFRSQTKFYRLYSFGRSIPAIRKKIAHDLSLPGMPMQKVLAAVICIMEKTSIRVGNGIYEKLYGSFGLTTLKDRHVKICEGNIQFVFKGKKGVAQNISIESRRLSNIVKKCRDIPGKELFQYYDEKGNHKCIDSGMVNDYLKNISGNDFTAKDFRTWSGSVHALMAFKEMEECETISQIKKNIVTALDFVARHLGNTRTVCKKYYVHPVIISLYENKTLKNYFSDSAEGEKPGKHDLDCDERILMKILEEGK